MKTRVFLNILFFGLMIVSSYVLASTKSICGTTDDRRSHEDSRIGRISSDESLLKCTATLIGKNCAITAGHCVALLNYVEFNVPLSIDGKPQPSHADDKFYPDPSFLNYEDRSIMGDWAVFKLKRNINSHNFPGESYGFYKVIFQEPLFNDSIRIAGYGSDLEDGSKHFSLKEGFGLIVSFKDDFPIKVLRHNIDATNGDSGSAIVRQVDQSIIGIHTHSGCSAIENDPINLNRGTLLSAHIKLQNAIKSCLEQN